MDLVEQLPNALFQSTFYKSLYEQLKKFGKLSPKQVDCLKEAVYKDERTQFLLNGAPECPFVESLRQQYDFRGQLSDLQLVALSKIHR